MSVETLEKFLNEANKSTYAKKDAPKVPSTRLESEDYHFEKDELIYHDTYFGGRDFIGEEIVYENKKPVWGANYFGYILNDETNEKDVYDFLRAALMQEYDDAIPVRGPAYYRVDDKEYRFVATGDLTNFFGTEEISFGGKVAYRCQVHGGMIR